MLPLKDVTKARGLAERAKTLCQKAAGGSPMQMFVANFTFSKCTLVIILWCKLETWKMGTGLEEGK